MVTSLAADAASFFYAAGVACRASPALRMLRAACSSAGFPVLVPGQVFSREILTFIRDLDTPEIHGYQPDNEKAIEMCRPTDAPANNGHHPLPAEPPEPASARA